MQGLIITASVYTVLYFTTYQRSIVELQLGEAQRWVMLYTLQARLSKSDVNARRADFCTQCHSIILLYWMCSIHQPHFL